MHIPDGFINGATSATAGVVAAGGIGYSMRRAGQMLRESRTAVAGLLAAFIFAAQMVNFPVAAGTSGHLIGAGLAAVLVGPWAAVVILSVVLGVQALVFADGGLTALGLNVINMAVIGSLVAWTVFRLTMRILPRRTRLVPVAAGLAAGASVVAAAAGFVVQYWVGGTSDVRIGTVLGAMVGVHLLIGIGEGIITGLVVQAVLATRPDLVTGVQGMNLDGAVPADPRRLRRLVPVGLAVALAVGVIGSQFASSAPDGLERVAIDQGFDETARDSAVAGAPLAEYGANLDNERVGTGLAGLVGTGLAFAAGIGALAVARRSRKRGEVAGVDA
jgi:cobalt/nickel transport system permease protein